MKRAEAAVAAAVPVRSFPCARALTALLVITVAGVSGGKARADGKRVCLDRIAWASQQLDENMWRIRESARRNRVPSRFLAVVILDELWDWGPEDTAQPWVWSNGSVGIVQMNVPPGRASS